MQNTHFTATADESRPVRKYFPLKVFSS